MRPVPTTATRRFFDGDNGFCEEPAAIFERGGIGRFFLLLVFGCTIGRFQ
jgi:hypothetical protein